MKTESRKRFEALIEKIAGVKVTMCLCPNDEWLLEWEGADRKPFENLKNKGLNVFDFEIDSEDGFDFTFCVLKI